MLTLLLAAAQTAATPVTVPPQPQLTEQIRAADAELFKLFFEGPCDVPRFRGMITDDIEFYHDRGGFNVRKPDDFVGQFKERCTNLLDPKSDPDAAIVAEVGARLVRDSNAAKSPFADNFHFYLVDDHGTMLNAFLDRPWLGIGLGGFETFYPMRRDPACGIYGEWEYLHSVYLEILLSGGVVFFLFALALIIWMARLFFAGYMRRRGFRVVPLAGGAVLMLVLLHSILDFSVQIPGIGLVVAAIFGSVMPIASRSPRRRAERYSVNIVLKD